MNKQALFLFFILLAGLVLCSFLGGNYHSEEGFAVSTYTGVNKQPSSSKDENIKNTFVGPEGNIYTNNLDYKTTKYDNYNHYDGTSHPTMYYGPHGSTAKFVHSNGVHTIIITDISGNTSVYKIDENFNAKANVNANTNKIKKYYGPQGSKAYVTTKNGETFVEVIDIFGSSIKYSSKNQQTYNPDYNNINIIYNPYTAALPSGIPGSQIPPGHEDLYILKSEVIPPVCPACPACQNTGSSSSSSSQEKCQPCPPCGRCPEPSFECKKVPNYNSTNNEFLPQPVLNSFSSFGM